MGLSSDFNKRLASYPRQNALALALREFGRNRTHALYARLAARQGSVPARERGLKQGELKTTLAKGPRMSRQTVGDGQAALERNPPVPVLSDVMMPGLDGFGLLQRLRADERTRTLPFIMLSARVGEEARIGGLNAGADDYLIKPFSARELLARVGTHLEMAQLRRAAATILQESEKRFRELADSAPVMIWITDPASEA